MPLLTLNELEKATPLFRGKCGNTFCKGLMHMLSVDKVNDIYDRNSDFYYSLGLLDWKVRLLRLPAEVFNKRGKVTRISLGEIILPEQLQKYESIDELRDFLRNKVYNQQ